MESIENINQIIEDNDFIDENGISLNNKNENIESNLNINIPNSSSKALPLVIFEKGKFIIPKEAKDLLTQNNFSKIGIISLVGKYRTGKSFLLNRVLLNRQKNSGFGVGPTFRPCTKGIWIWPEPLIISNNQCSNPFPCFLIDTEGLGAYIEEINHDTKIFLIAILISSLFIYNSFGAIDEISLTSLSLVLNLGETIKIKSLSHKDTEEELAEYFPALLWLLRDFSLKLEDINGNAITEKEYLEKALENVNGSNEIIDEKNRVRKLIRTYFPQRDCFTMVRPVENEKDLQNLEYIPDEQLRSEFLKQAQIFRDKIINITTPKTFHKKLLSGSMLIELIENILDTINSGSIPIIENSWRYVIQNEAIKSTENLFNKFSKEIRKFREENKNEKDFDKKMKNFTQDLTKKYINELNDNELFDDDMKKEFSNKLKNKINDELDNFDKENENIFEEKLNQNLDILSDNIINSIRKNNNNPNLSFNSFFQELDLFKEKANQLSPDFKHKNEIILDKAILLAKKFIDEMKSNKNNINEDELNKLKNENINQKLKIKEYQQKIKNSNIKKDIHIENLNNEYLTLKLKLQKLEDKLSLVERAEQKEKEKYENELNELIDNYEKKIKKILEKDDSYDTELNMKNEQLNILKNNNEKIIDLNEKKFQYYENEITMLKDKIEHLLNLSNTELKKNLKNNNIVGRNTNNEIINKSISKLMSAVNDHIEEQNMDNQLIINKLIQEKEIESKNDKTIIRKLVEIKEKNKELQKKSNKANSIIKTLQEQIMELKPYHDLINNISNIKCIKCNKYFTLEKYKQHKNNCYLSNSLASKKDIDISFNSKLKPEKLNIRILKGKIKNESSGHPYLEYIIEVNYNNTQTWRLGKKFSDFTKLYNILNTEYKEYIKIPISNIFIDLNNSSNFGSFHENKIMQLELFINDIVEMDMINRSKPFIKFIEFDKYYDESNDTLLGIKQKSKQHKENNYYNINNNNFQQSNNIDSNQMIYSKKKYVEIDDNFED